MKKLLLVLLALFLCSQFVFGADNTKAVSVGTSATQIVPLNPKRIILIIHNNGTATVFLGFTATDCTTATGMPLLVDTYVIFIGKADPIYGIVASGTQEVRVWEDEH